MPTHGPSGHELVEIRILELPVAVAARAQEHAADLLREFTLIAARPPSGDGHELPGQLTQLVESLTRDYGGFTAEQEMLLADAITQGRESLDLVYRVPESVGDAVRHLGELLDRADGYCQAGEHLLTLATPPEALDYRRWYLGEFTRQLAGEAPLAWPMWASEQQG